MGKIVAEIHKTDDDDLDEGRSGSEGIKKWQIKEIERR